MRFDSSEPYRALSGECNYYPQLSDEEIRLREMEYFAEGHIASKWQIQDLKSGSLPRPSTIPSTCPPSHLVPLFLRQPCSFQSLSLGSARILFPNFWL